QQQEQPQAQQPQRMIDGNVVSWQKTNVGLHHKDKKEDRPQTGIYFNCMEWTRRLIGIDSGYRLRIRGQVPIVVCLDLNLNWLQAGTKRTGRIGRGLVSAQGVLLVVPVVTTMYAISGMIQMTPVPFGTMDRVLE